MKFIQDRKDRFDLLRKVCQKNDGKNVDVIAAKLVIDTGLSTKSVKEMIHQLYLAGEIEVKDGVVKNAVKRVE